MTAPFGLYYLANDRAVDWLIASLESVRAMGYQGPITIIPYDEATSQITKLATRYDFSVWQHSSLQELDRIGESLKPEQRAHIPFFRKWAAYWGEYENFLYSDVDVVALVNYQDILEKFKQCNLEFMYFSSPIRSVYQPGFTAEMVRQYNSPRYNAGFWAGRRGVFSLAAVEELAGQAQMVRKNFLPNVTDQSFMNYCTDVKAVRAASVVEVFPDFSRRNSARHRFYSQDGALRLNMPGDPSHARRLPYIHWAGISLNPWMPQRGIFLKYRLEPMPRGARWRKRFVWQILCGPAPALRSLANTLPGTRQLMGYLYTHGKRTRALRDMNVSLGEVAE